VVQRAQGKNAERRVAAGDGGRNRVHRAIAPAGDDERRLCARRPARQVGELLAIAGGEYLRFAACAAE
jgi:hypothetical protein